MSYEYEQTSSPTFNAIIVSTLIGLTIASIPSIIAYQFLIARSDSIFDEVLAYIIIVSSTGFSFWLSIWVLYPIFKEMFNEESKELPVLKPRDALSKYFAI